MSIKTITVDDFDFYRLFTTYKELDAHIKSNPDGLDIKVKRLGTYSVRTHAPLSGNFMRYGNYWVTCTEPVVRKPRTIKNKDINKDVQDGV